MNGSTMGTCIGSDESVRRSFKLLNTQQTQGDNLDGLLDLVDDDLLKSAIVDADERAAKQKAEQIAYGILEIRAAKNQRVSDLVKQIRELREVEKRLLSQIEYLNAAMDYGVSKLNFNPLQTVIVYHGVSDFNVFDQEWLKGWRQAQKDKKAK